jgi:tetratricopeptide (TPR) repeat protein
VAERLKLGIVITALGLFGVSSFAVAANEVDACGSRKVTKKVDKPLIESQKARDEKNWPVMLAKAQEADAIPVEKSTFDMFWIQELEGVAYANLKQYPEASAKLEATLNSPCMAEADKPNRNKLLMQLAYQSKDYPRAIQFGKIAQQSTSDPDTVNYLGNAYYITNDFESARTLFNEMIGKLEADGKTPEEQTYRILQSACVNLKDNDCVVAQSEKLVAHYPKPAYWQDVTNWLLRGSPSDKELLNILRLMDGVGILTEGNQYTELAQLALAQGLPGEAQSLLEKGVANGIVANARDKALAASLLTEAKAAVTLDRSTLSKQEAAARAKPTGEADVKLGAAYLSYAELDKAIEAIQRGLGKGGVKNTDEAGLLLGIAYMRANKKTEAATAFRTVTKDPGLTRIAKLWVLHAERGPAVG